MPLMFRIIGAIAAVVFIATGFAEGAERAPLCDDALCFAVSHPLPLEPR